MDKPLPHVELCMGVLWALMLFLSYRSVYES
nr:MAG TPA: hypothetical protein [Caudoviricetes sp.]